MTGPRFVLALAAALIAAPALAHGVYHIGGGEPVAWRRLIAAFKANGRDVSYTDGEADISIGEAEARPVFSIDRIAAATGFAPRSIEDGIAQLLSAGNARS